MRASDTEVLIPTSAEQAIEDFGDGREVTVFAGGTILMPEVAYGRYPRGGRTVMLQRAGLDEISGDGTVKIGAMTTLNTLAASGIEPLATAAADVADVEIRAQATLGGNLCAPPGVEAPRGDLQPALIAADASVLSSGPGGERTDPVEDFLAARQPESRLVLAIELQPPGKAAFVSMRRSHAHSYAVLSVACAEAGGGVRVAAAGVAPHAVRLTSVERALGDGASPSEAAADAVEGLDPPDDALATSWYRRQVLPTLVTRALEQLKGG